MLFFIDYNQTSFSSKSTTKLCRISYGKFTKIDKQSHNATFSTLPRGDHFLSEHAQNIMFPLGSIQWQTDLFGWILLRLFYIANSIYVYAAYWPECFQFKIRSQCTFVHSSCFLPFSPTKHVDNFKVIIGMGHRMLTRIYVLQDIIFDIKKKSETSLS